MPLQKLQLRPGINRENTRYKTEGGWYECDKVRFRQGSPEKIGGWEPLSTNTFSGVCRSLWNWITLGGQNLVGVGTSEKFYLQQSGVFNDITPIRSTALLTDPFETTSGSSTVTVTDTAHGAVDGDYVSFSGASAVGGLTIDGEYQLTYIDEDTYAITAASNATSSATGGGSVTAAYQINVGAAFVVPQTGWGAGGWSLGTWANGVTSTTSIRLWSQSNFGEDLVFGVRNGGVYYWDASGSLTTRAVPLSDLSGASDTPTVQSFVLVSDVSRFVFAFGANELGGSTQDPMLVRWSDQENAANWTPAATNQAGDLRLSNGSQIISAAQARQEVLVWTDTALYSMQYQGAPAVWGAQLVGENVSIASPNATAYANGVAYWMGKDKFYRYDGRTQPLRCDLRKFIFSDLDTFQYDQVTAGTNEAYNEIWWFYCSSGSTTNDRYVVYNYVEDIWYYGTMARTAWLDSGVRNAPIAATYSNTLVQHESGLDDNETGVPSAMSSFVTSSEFDLNDGQRFMFVWRMLPDVTFEGSTADAPTVDMTLLPLDGSGSGYSSPASVGGENAATVTRSTTVPIEQFTNQISTRVRGRQLVMKVSSDGSGVAWQLGAPRLDMRPDGRR